MMTEVESAAEAGADLLMECDEEEQEAWPSSPERHEEEEGDEEGQDEGLQAAIGLMEDEQETDPPPVQIIPIPVQPVKTSSPPSASSTVKSAGAALGFTVNGRLVPMLPGGGGAELRLRSHPGGSASGFTTVQIPVTVTLHSPAGTHHINTTASLTAAVTASTPDPTPIITGVVSGEAAQKVLSDHNVNFKSSPPQTGLRTPPSVAFPLNLTTLHTTPPEPYPRRRPAASHKLLRKGELEAVCPPDCPVCKSQYKLITELRGFMCLCSPVIAQSLRNLKRSRLSRRSREKKLSTKGSRTRSGLPASKVGSPLQSARSSSNDFLSDPFTSPATCSPLQWDRSGTQPDPPQGKLVILVEDFYYGSAPGRSAHNPSPVRGKCSGPYRCIHCPKTLRNNIKLMSHMQEHVSMMSQQDGEMDTVSSCPHCFRHFVSPFRLQCHLEAVHSLYKSTVTCRICELAFGSEPDFLWHMKTTHKPGEMPYICQVCDFRSSFHSDVWSHFQEAHADTRNLLCQYCLRVLRSNTCYQQHFARHQKKHVLSCDKCRLHFLYVKERIEHGALHHRTHVRPAQLSGLRPGTKVTVRTYSVVGSEEEPRRTVAPCKVVDVSPPPPTLEAPKRKPVESLGPLLSGLGDDRVCRPSQRCVECLNSVADFRSHFPSLVHCSLCRFITCCSTSYANHMINNHATCRKNLQYQTIFQHDPRLSATLRCVLCRLTTCRGDVMANHLTERHEHTCVVLTHTEPSADGAQKDSDSVTSSGGQGGAFIPIHLFPTRQTSSQLSVKHLTSLSPRSSLPAMTIKILGPRPPSEESLVSTLSVPQLSIVLSSLCHGIAEASRRHQTHPLTIRSWMGKQQRGLPHRKWCWRTDKMAEWVLSRRERQLTVDEEVLLQTARDALGKDSLPAACYSWTVDFLLRNHLGLQTSNNNRLLRSVRDSSRSFIQALCAQIKGRTLPECLGCMDEFPIFIDSDQFSDQNLSAFQLFGSPEDKPVFDIVLSALSDGSFLPPLLFFRGSASSIPEGFPNNVLLEARRDGFSDEERLHIWIDKVWCPHLASQCGGESLLMVDVHRGHLTHKFRDSLSSASTDVAFIPPGCCCRLQPLDLCVTPVLRDFLQARWIQLTSHGGLDGLGLDQLALTLACWLSEVSSTLNSETHILRRSFSWVCNLQPVEDRGETARMIATLTEALIRPLETTGPGPVELLVVMEEEDKHEDRQEEDLLLKGPSALRLVFDSDQDMFQGFHDG